MKCGSPLMLPISSPIWRTGASSSVPLHKRYSTIPEMSGRANISSGSSEPMPRHRFAVRFALFWLAGLLTILLVGTLVPCRVLALSPQGLPAKVLRWAADTSSGAPYVFQDPANPTKLIGFEVDLINALADELG